jgi:hypothetical protein
LPFTETRNLERLAVVDRVSSRVRGSVRGGDLSFLDVYFQDLRSAGELNATLNVAVSRGVIEPDARIDLAASSVSVASPRGRFAGNANLALTAPKEGDTLRVHVTAPEIRGAERAGGIAGPTLRDVTANLTLAPRRLSQPLRMIAADASIPQAHAPALAWFEPWLGTEALHLSGAARFSGRASRGPNDALSLDLDLDGKSLGVATGSFRIRSDTAVRVRVAREAGSASPRGELGAHLRGARRRRSTSPCGPAISGRSSRLPRGSRETSTWWAGAWILSFLWSSASRPCGTS